LFPERAFGKLGVAKNFGEQATADVFARVDWDDRSPTVRMPQVMVTAPDADDLKAEVLQSRDKLATRNAWQPTHSATLMR